MLADILLGCSRRGSVDAGAGRFGLLGARFIRDAGYRRQAVDNLLGQQKREIEGGEADRDDHQQHVEIAGDPVDSVQCVLERGAAMPREEVLAALPALPIPGDR